MLQGSLPRRNLNNRKQVTVHVGWKACFIYVERVPRSKMARCPNLWMSRYGYKKGRNIGYGGAGVRTINGYYEYAARVNRREK